MSVEQVNPPRAARPSSDARLVEYDEYIDRQIKSTRRAVKAVDFATALVVLASAVLAFLLVAAAVEHWLVPHGFPAAVQWILFLLLVGGTGYFAYRRLWPLCVRAINPVYAAQAIEQENPSLKNTLINLLFFRQRRAEVSEAVYKTLEEQAAQRLTRVPVDAAVDRSQLIRLGYVLLAVVAAAALYKALSPKDPLIAAERVLMPWADIVPASRVTIAAVEPGAVTVTRGEFLDVSAEVRGIGEDDPVLLRFTTPDGRAVNKPIVMKLTNNGLRFTGRLPDVAEASGAAGIAQDLTYRIEAGDARTLDYQVKVVAAPAMLVERIEYDYPAYTGYVDRSVADLGDIRAIEGTRVTIHARANGPIQQADVDFDADGRRDLRMRAEGMRASAAFELALRSDRQTPRHASYVLRFRNDEGRENRDPAKFAIEVLPDYAPEVAIVSPPEKSLDVRLNDTIAIDVEATDPDFALADVRVQGEAIGRPAIDVSLLDGKDTRRFTGRYRFTPSEHQLRAGDIVEYWVNASDIRAPKPNTTSTERRIFRITSPDPAQPPPDRIAQRDRPQQPGGQQGQQGQQQGGEAQGEQGGEASQAGEPGEQQPGESGQQGNQQPRQNGRPQGQRGQAGESNGEPQQGDESTAGGQASRTDGAGDAQSRRQGDAQDSSGTQGQTENRQQTGQRKPTDKQTGAGTAGGEGSSQSSQPAGTRQPNQPDAGSARPDQGMQPRGTRGDQQSDATASDSTPVSPEGDDDGAAFQRIREHLRRRGELNDEPPTTTDQDGQPNNETDSPNGDAQAAESAAADEDKPQDGAEAPRTGDPRGLESPHALRSAEKDDARQPTDRGSKTQADSAEDDTGRTDDQGEGTGADTRQDDVPGRDKPPSETGEQTKSPGGQQTTTKGPSGAGEQPGENQGVPDSAQNMRPADKRQQSPSRDSQQDDQEPPAPGEGKRESDSHGEMGGDRPGGGEEGGGQKGNRDGTGSAGQNQSADEGAGESSEQGAGNKSPNAGRDAPADHKTGQPGSNEQGPGSRQRQGAGDQPGGKSGADQQPARQHDSAQQSGHDPGDHRQGMERGEPTPPDGKQPGGQNRDQSAGGPGVPTGDGGNTGTSAGPPPAEGGTVPDGDAANLEYARKQTDLVLERLADQLKRRSVDKNMLDKLGWTEDDLRAFVERWQRRKQAARDAKPADAARRELDDALRSLGLRRGPLQQSSLRDDAQRDLREGYRGPVPTAYQERLRAYNQGISRARQESE